MKLTHNFLNNQNYILGDTEKQVINNTYKYYCYNNGFLFPKIQKIVGAEAIIGTSLIVISIVSMSINDDVLISSFFLFIGVLLIFSTFFTKTIILGIFRDFIIFKKDLFVKNKLLYHVKTFPQQHVIKEYFEKGYIIQ